MDPLVNLRRPVPAELVSLLESQSGPAILLSPNYTVVATNAAYRNHYENDLVVGTSRCFEVSHGYATPCNENGESCPLQEAASTRRPARAFHVHQSPTGPEHVDVQLTPLLDEHGEISYFLEQVQVIEASSARAQGTFVGRSPAFMRVVELIQRAARFDVPVLVLGESGTGKELAAKALHGAGPRAGGPFVPVECSGLPEALFESELFGHARGAFTGADKAYTGLVEAAKGGTLFLDEIGDVPLSMQIKLLRLIESGTYRRVGETERRPLEARVVLATHRNLSLGVTEGWFRRDLFYRINAFPIELPPLRQRTGDLPLLVDAILESTGCRKRLGPAAMQWLEAHPLPGNVRQLRNLLERAHMLSDGDTITVAHLGSPDSLEPAPAGDVPGWAKPELRPLREVERAYLGWARDTFTGERSELAARLGLSERTLYRKLKGLDP